MYRGPDLFDLAGPNSRHASTIRRLARQYKYELHAGGIFIPGFGNFGGVFTVWKNNEAREFSDNLIPTEGLNSSVGIWLAGVAAIPAWYTAIYEDNQTPLATWDGSNIVGNSNEFTDYSQGARPVFTPGAVSGGAVDNSASNAAFNITAVSAVDIYGAFLISQSGKGVSGGTLAAATLFATSKNVITPDVLNVGYTFTMTSA